MPNHLCPHCQTGPETPYRRLDPYPSVTRPEGVLTIDGFAYIQRRSAVVMLNQLLHGCWQAYRNALLLTRPGTLLPDLFDRYPRADMAPLIPTWDRVCVWYRRTLFDPQLTLFDCPYNLELDRWHHWVDRHCFGVILDRPEWVRMILEVLGYLPATTRDPDILLEDEPLFAAACFDTIINANQETIDAY